MEIIHRKNAIEIALIGKLDMETARRFENIFHENLLNSSEEVIGLNMSNLKFLDSSGLSILMKITNEANSKGKKIFYISLSPTILSVIKVARLDNLLLFITSEEFNSRHPIVQ